MIIWAEPRQISRDAINQQESKPPCEAEAELTAATQGSLDLRIAKYVAITGGQPNPIDVEEIRDIRPVVR